MADAAIDVFLGLATDLIKYNVELISNVKGDFKFICDDMERMKGFLLDAATPECRESASIKTLIAQIRDVTYDAEDTIEQYVMYQYGGVFRRIWDYRDIQEIAEEFKEIRERIKRIKEDRLFYDIHTLRRPHSQRTTIGHIPRGVGFAKGDEVVGLEKETADLIDLLTSDYDERKDVLIAGMPGLGKSTLANKVYSDVKNINYKFLYLVWVCVSEQYNRGEVLRQIWRAIGDNSMGDPNNIASDITPDELTEHINCRLEKEHCLIVLDDIWSAQAWNELKNAFPRENKNLRVLITSRLSKVAPDAQQFPLKHLEPEKGFELLEKRVFRKQKCPSHLKDVAEQIVVKCGGLPLAIVIIAGVLMQRPVEKSCWEDVSARVTENVADEENCRMIVRLSYDNLPHHLRACFLYFGIFPKSAPIAVSKLFCLWIAEGLIKAEEGMDLEDVAEKYLQELVDRNIVLIEDTKCTNKIKKCRVHDILHDLCIKEAREDKMFNQIKDLEHFLGELTREVKNYRRISIHQSAHSRVLEYIMKAPPSAALVRSFLSLGPDVLLPLSDKKTFLGQFQLLRVLDITSVLLPRLPDALPKLVHLRYVAIYISFNTISTDMTKLSKLQVLIVKVEDRRDIYSLKIAANIWDMYQLRHIQTNIPAYFSSKKIQQATKSPVRTITYVSPEACTVQFFHKIDRVKKLGIRGDLDKLPVAGPDGFSGFSSLEHLQILKIKNESTSEGKDKMSLFPVESTFPKTIKQLTLSKTNLEWDKHMNIIAMLPNLVVLKLKDEAFVGKHWPPTNEGFSNLEVFCLGKTDLEVWDASSDHFPMITSIFLMFCDKLKTIPIDFENLPNLQKLDLYSTNSAVANSARAIQESKKNSQVELKLSVFPPEH